MSNRTVIGNRGSTFGAYVSKPGFDVLTCSILDMAFSSDCGHLRLVATGQVTIGPTGINGGEVTQDVLYDKTYSSPLPFVIAMAKSADWTLQVNASDHIADVRSIGQHADYANNWITRCREAITLLNLGSGFYVSGVTFGFPGSAANVHVPTTFASIKFETRLFTNRVQFAVNNSSHNTIVRYMIFDPSLG